MFIVYKLNTDYKLFQNSSLEKVEAFLEQYHKDWVEYHWDFETDDVEIVFRA